MVSSESVSDPSRSLRKGPKITESTKDPTMSNLIVDFTLNAEAREDALDIPGVCIYGAGGIDPTIEDGTIVVRFKDVDETLVESMNPDELLEFLGIDSEYLIAIEVVD